MKNSSLLIVIVLFAKISFAQPPCIDDIIMNVKGTWKKRSDDNIKGGKDQPQIINRLDAISKLFQTAYPDPKGIEAGWYRSINGDPLINNGPTPYQFNSLYKAWYCNQNYHKLMLGDETGTWSYVYVNNFGWFMTHQYDELPDKIAGATAFLLPKKIGDWKGFPLYEPSGNPDKCKAILITRNNQLPYKPVTRLQYLKTTKEVLEIKKKKEIDFKIKTPERTETEQEAAKQKGLENALIGAKPNKVEERTANYLKRYRTDRQLKEESVQLTEKYYNDLIKPYDDVWNSLDKEALNEPAIVNATNIWYKFKGFTTQEKGGRMIVFLNADYFNLKLPKYVPQFIVLYWEWDENAPAQNFKKQLENHFDFPALQNMLDK